MRGGNCSSGQVERFIRISVSAQMANEAGASGKMLQIVQRGQEHSQSQEAGEEHERNWWMDDAFGDDEDDAEYDCEAEDFRSEAEFPSEPPDTSMLLCDVISRARGGDMTVWNRKQKENNITFYSATEVKSSMMSTMDGKERQTAARWLMMCRFTGLLVGCYQSYIMYVPNANGMDWREKIVGREISAKNGFIRHFHPGGETIPSRNNDGIMLIKNTKDLRDIYYDKLKRRKGKEVLGKSLDHLYVFTMDKHGVDQLRQLVTEDAAETETKLIGAALESGIYERNTAVHGGLFPLRTQEGLLISVGTYMDINRIHNIETITNRFDGIEYGILCYDWQLPYYQSVMPGAKYMTVSE